LRSSNMLKE